LLILFQNPGNPKDIILIPFISVTVHIINRAPKSAKAYEHIGGGSPINNYTSAQSQLVEAELHKRGYSQIKCYYAMRYWHPYLEEVFKQTIQDKMDFLVFMPLYPQYSISTTGSSLKLIDYYFNKRSPRKLKKLFGKEAVASHHTTISSWYQHPTYLLAMANLILDQLTYFSDAERAEGIHILFSAHGVPVKYVKEGDPYKGQIEETFQLVQEEIRRQVYHLSRSASTSSSTFNNTTNDSTMFCPSHEQDHDPYSQFTTEPSDYSLFYPSFSSAPNISFYLSYQSRVGPVEWLRPYTDEMIKVLGERGVHNLIVVPVSFVSDHIETLEEMDHEYRALALSHGIKHWRRCPALNTYPLFIKALTEVVVSVFDYHYFQLRFDIYVF
jgi:ferrochelatase